MKKKYIKIYIRKEGWKNWSCCRSMKEAQNEIRRWIDQQPLEIESKDSRAKKELEIFQYFLLQGVK